MPTKSDFTSAGAAEGNGLRQAYFAKVVATVGLASAFAMMGCTKHPQVSFSNRTYAAALRTACSAKDATMLEKAEHVIERDHASGQIGNEEMLSYEGIIETARSGEWERAERECHRFQTDQLAR